MRFKSIHLVNYIGIYNGLNIYDLYIDFSKCKHNTILIKGDNGSGKSTLFGALNPLPDNNDSFIPNMAALKELELYDNDGTLYFLRFSHGIKNNGDRDVTKAYIYKILNNGMQQDMNPNGNVSSFKDILYDEFRLDSNFVALSQLSNEDKGLADKKPAERKKFVNSIIETLETYNNIYKSLTKKSNALKTMINSISMKLDNLGNIEILNSNLLSLEKKIQILSDQRNLSLERKADARATINIIDPDNSIQQRYTELNTQLTSYINEEKGLSTNMNRIMSKIDTSTNLDKQLESINSRLTDTAIQIQTLKNEKSTLLADREEDSQKLQCKVQKLKALQNNSNIDIINRGIENSRNKISYCEDIFNKIGVRDAIKISKEEYIIALNALKEIKDNIDYFKSDSSYTELQIALNCITTDTIPDIEVVKNQIDDIKNSISNNEKILSSINTRDDILKRLSARPDDCVRDDCGFVNSIKQSIKDMPVQSYTDVANELKVLSQLLLELNDTLNQDIIILDHIGRIKAIIRLIDNNRAILQKFDIKILHIDNLEIFREFMNGESFKYIDELYSYIDYANLFEEYKISKDSLINFENQLNIYNSKNSIIDEIMRDIDDLNDKLDLLSKKIEEDDSVLFSLEQLQMKLTVDQNNIKFAIDTINNNKELENNIKQIKSELDSMYFNMDKIQTAMGIITDCTSEIINLSGEINQLSQERDKVLHAIEQAQDYQNELQELSSTYNIIEKVRYYSSPTSGIQLIFMDLYMSKILQLANQLLSYLFEGRFIIQPFIITDTEFKIPILGNGYMNDDITSLSSGEKAMISMIISLSLLYQSSTKYNILKLDEIDAPLDTTNRLQFLFVLDKLIEILQAEQCIMISHNNEINTDNVDLIILKNSSGEIYNGNVIFKY